MNPAELANIARLEASFWWYAGMSEILFGLIDPFFPAGVQAKVLEAGCGTGSMASAFEQRYGAQMYPTDLAWQAIEYTRGSAAQRPIQSDITELPYASAAFDAAVSLDVLVHLKPGREKNAIAELARVLKVNGLLIIRVAALDILRSRHSQFIQEFQRFTRGRLCSLLEGHGFQILRSTYANSILLPVALMKFRVWEPLVREPATSGVSEIHPRLNSLLRRVLHLEARLLAKGHNLAAGQSVIVVARKL